MLSLQGIRNIGIRISLKHWNRLLGFSTLGVSILVRYIPSSFPLIALSEFLSVSSQCKRNSAGERGGTMGGTRALYGALRVHGALGYVAHADLSPHDTI